MNRRYRKGCSSALINGIGVFLLLILVVLFAVFLGVTSKDRHELRQFASHLQRQMPKHQLETSVTETVGIIGDFWVISEWFTSFLNEYTVTDIVTTLTNVEYLFNEKNITKMVDQTLPKLHTHITELINFIESKDVIQNVNKVSVGIHTLLNNINITQVNVILNKTETILNQIDNNKLDLIMDNLVNITGNARETIQKIEEIHKITLNI